MWPEVYRLKNGKYIEASRDFPNFYHDEVLPRLADDVNDAQKRLPPGAPDSENLAVLKMQRDKILRVIDRQPTAGLEQAREWMNGPDPQLIGYAAAVFRDLGGHDADVRAAEAAFKAALAHERAARQGG